jgi:hypothetical protein
MKELKAVITTNPYFWSPNGETILTEQFRVFHRVDINYINLLLSYPVPDYRDVDLFQFIDTDSLTQLRNGKTVLVFDSTFEGFSPDVTPIARSLYHSCVLNNIDPKKVFFFTGNLIDNSAEINIVPIFLLDNYQNWSESVVKGLKRARYSCNKNYEKIILSLSRRNRSHRVIAQCMLFNSELRTDSIISQDVLDYDINPYAFQRMGVSVDQYQNFKSSLPLIADANQFDVNDPFNALPDLHSKTTFSIVNETLVDNVGNTSFFFSEKFLKPIVNFQPMLIYGHQGINKKLNLLGFKSYESYFNLDFDDEPDDILRYKKLLLSAEAAVNELKTLSIADRVNWRFKNRKLLKYNYDTFINRVHSKKQMLLFSQLLTAIKF